MKHTVNCPCCSEQMIKIGLKEYECESCEETVRAEDMPDVEDEPALIHDRNMITEEFF